MLACHHCDVTSCVNPDHLYWGTYRDNNLDGYNRGRMTSPSKRGEESPVAVLTEAAVREIWDSTAILQQLADRFGVSIGAISAVIYGKTWQQITGGDRRDPRASLTARYVREVCFGDWET
jgi:hypothetical protein